MQQGNKKMTLCMCNACVKRRVYWKTHRLKNKEKIAARDKIRNRKWRLANLDRVRERDRAISKAYYANRVKPPKPIKPPKPPRPPKEVNPPKETKKQIALRQREANRAKLAAVTKLAIELGYFKPQQNGARHD
jgi:hypothetical protein